MSEMKWAIITGADGGMGTEITRAVAKAGYRIIMACYHPQKAEVVRERLSKETGNPDLGSNSYRFIFYAIRSCFCQSDLRKESSHLFVDE